MGMTIGLYNVALMREGKSRWPESDARFEAGRHEGDKEFSDWIGQDDNGEFLPVEYSPVDVECYERPKDIQKARKFFKALITEEDNRKRWSDLLDLLESDTEKHLWLLEVW